MSQNKWEKLYLTLRTELRKINKDNTFQLSIITTKKEYEKRVKKLVWCPINTEWEFYQLRVRKGSQAAFKEVQNDGLRREEDFPLLAPTKRTISKEKNIKTKREANADAKLINTDEQHRLKNMRDIKAKLDEENIQIDNIKQSQQGHMMVIMRKGCEELKELQDMAGKKMGGGGGQDQPSHKSQNIDDGGHGCNDYRIGNTDGY